MEAKIASTLSNIVNRCFRAASPSAARERSEDVAQGKPATSINDDMLKLIDPLFDETWYRNRYPTTVATGEDPRFRYLQDPAARNHSPHPLFDGKWYLTQHPEVAAADLHPLLHYMRIGAALGLTPHPLFDGKRYLEQHPELAEAGINPLLHYLRDGAALGYSPCAAFDSAWYQYNNPDVVAQGMNPLLHFVLFGAREGRLPHPLDEVAAFQAVARSENLLKAARLLDWRQHLLPQDGTVPYVATFAWGDIYELSSLEPTVAAAPHRTAPGSDQVLRLKSAVVIGGTTSIIVADRFVSAEALDAQEKEGPSRYYGGAWRVGETAIVRFKRKARTYIPEGIHLTGNAEDTFVDFLSSILPRLLSIEACGIDSTVPLLVSESAGEMQIAVLQYLNKSGRPIISLEKAAAYATDILYYPVRSDVGVDGAERSFIDGLANEIGRLALVRERILESGSGAVSDRFRRLYIRPSNPSRQLSHDGKLCEALIDRDFEIVTIETLPFHVIVRLIGNASMVVLHSDEFAHALWCRPGCHIVNIDDFGKGDASDARVRDVISRSTTVHTLRSTFACADNDERPRPFVDFPTLIGVLDELIAAAGQPRSGSVSYSVVTAN